MVTSDLCGRLCTLPDRRAGGNTSASRNNATCASATHSSQAPWHRKPWADLRGRHHRSCLGAGLGAGAWCWHVLSLGGQWAVHRLHDWFAAGSKRVRHLYERRIGAIHHARDRRSFFLRGTPLSGLARFHTPRGPGSPTVPGSTCTRHGSGVAGDRECRTPKGRADLDRARIERARPRKGKPMAARTRGHKVKRGMSVTGQLRLPQRVRTTWPPASAVRRIADWVDAQRGSSVRCHKPTNAAQQSPYTGCSITLAHRRPPLCELTCFCHGLRRPVHHVHFAVHRRRGGDVVLRLLAMAPAAVQFAEAKVAMGDERAHAAGLGERQRLAVVLFTMFAVA